MIVHARYPVGEPRVQREAAAARTAGYDVDVVALREDGESAEEEVDGVRVHRVGIRHVRGAGLRRMVREYVGFAVAAGSLVARLDRRGPFDVVHVHAPPDFLVAAAAFPRARGAHVLLDIHDLSSHMFGARFGGSPVGRVAVAVLGVVQRAACAFAERVVTVHEPYRQELLAAGVPAAKLAVVMNAADEAILERARGRAAATKQGVFELAYHGTINEWYGVDLVVRAVAALVRDIPTVRAVILGEGDALDDVMKLASELGVADRVEFSGRYLPIEQALARVAGASCGVIPNRPSRLNRFALSSKLFEYVALGIPVIVAHLETLAAYFGDDEVFFFEPGSFEALADAARIVAADGEEASARAARAGERARSYAWSVQAAGYVGLLDGLRRHHPMARARHRGG